MGQRRAQTGNRGAEGAYCDGAILRSLRDLEQNAARLGKAAADTFHELCVFQFGKRTCYAGNTASQIF